MKRRLGLILSAGMLLSVLGMWWNCSELKEEQGPVGAGMRLTYADLRPLFSARCQECHSSPTPAAGYDLSTYIGVLGRGSDEIPNAIAGDPNSLLVTKLQAEDHAQRLTEDELASIRRWVADDGLTLQQPGVHPAGWTTVDHEEFHGGVLEKRKQNFAECQACHGEDYKGGITGISCWTCHPGGPQVCATCHGNVFGDVELPFNWAPPEDVAGNLETTFRGVGAHQMHVRSSRLWGGGLLDCSECHLNPTEVEDPGHLDSDLPAEITFGELARSEGAEPLWDTERLQCSNVYCHGAFEYGNRENAPTWTNVHTDGAACGTCHSLPPPPETGHVQLNQCDLCHGTVVDEDRNIKDRTLHINGKADFQAHPGGWADVDHEEFHGKELAKTGWDLVECQQCHGTDYRGGITGSSCFVCHTGGPETCTTCHGNASGDVELTFNWAPPEDVAGHWETTFRGVGAHQTHVQNSTLRDALDCSACHIKPMQVEDPGHLDSELPAEVPFGELAGKEDVEPLWDSDALQCANVYCHGAFKFGNKDNAPIWTNVGAGQAACGTCHGLPPPAETGHVQMDQCSRCHGSVVDEDGNFEDRTLHVNGETDF